MIIMLSCYLLGEFGECLFVWIYKFFLRNDFVVSFGCGFNVNFVCDYLWIGWFVIWIGYLRLNCKLLWKLIFVGVVFVNGVNFFWIWIDDDFIIFILN